MEKVFVEIVETGEVIDFTGDDPRAIAKQLQFSMRNDGRHFNVMIKKTPSGYELVSPIAEIVKGKAVNSKLTPIYKISNIKPVSKVAPIAPKAEPKKRTSVYTVVWNVLKFLGNVVAALVFPPQKTVKRRK